MTKEELEKEADKWLENNLHSTEEDYKQAYLAGAEPREKQIQIDAEQIRALQKQNGELTDRVKELEAQNEKMKCCGNCENRYRQEKCADCHNYSKWKFKQAEQFYEEIAE